MDCKLNDVVVRLQQDIGQLRTDVQKEVVQLGNRVSQVEQGAKSTDERVGKIENAITKMRDDFQTSSSADQKMADSEVEEKLKRVEEQIRNLKFQDAQEKQNRDRDDTVLFGGLGAVGTEAQASEWVINKLWFSMGVEPVKVYSKSKSDFNGLIFAKFQSKEVRDSVVDFLGKVEMQSSGVRIWVQEDLPLPERVEMGILFGLKKLLVSWGEVAKSDCWVNKESRTLEVEKAFAVQVKVVHGALDIKYGDQWDSYLEGKEWKALVEKHESKIASGKDSKGVGKGKLKGGK